MTAQRGDFEREKGQQLSGEQMPDWQILIVRFGCLLGALLVMAGCTELVEVVAR